MITNQISLWFETNSLGEYQRKRTQNNMENIYTDVRMPVKVRGKFK